MGETERTFQAGRRRRSKGSARVEREQALSRGWSRRGLWEGHEGHDRREPPGTAGWQPGFGRPDRRWRCVSAGPCWPGLALIGSGTLPGQGAAGLQTWSYSPCRGPRDFHRAHGRAGPPPTCLRVLPSSSCSVLPGTLDVCVHLENSKG